MMSNNQANVDETGLPATQDRQRPTSMVYQSKRILNMKSKRKQNLVKKAHELARIADLDILLVVFDKDHQSMQEFRTN